MQAQGHISTRRLTQYSLFVGIILLLGLTQLGYIPLPFASFTIVHIPVIVGSFYFGKKGGMLLGFFFGLTSFINLFLRPGAIALIVLGVDFGLYNVFLILMIVFLPRVLVGLFSALTYGALNRLSSTVSMGIAAFIGSMTNTVLVLGFLYIFAMNASGAAFGLGEGFAPAELLKVLLGIVITNSLGEALLAVLLSTAIGKAMLHYTKDKNKEKE